ncbi:RsmE family RNA methyltransferase [Litorivivens lipolytica]|uniref:Ribosomal RNA small subunit methyltransferase E n=1 Tax=Litorivivens lipolytica TaxID=1524264 RepID=A0A7W4W3R8_9GAMM|nr:16S rRNA (uracil(1498)-N(3))-methyltransferase [Litorivivens lipolytica]MBB3046900.1 RsmE family RNA methyltransferase [Litorivivens lipolytica]
MNLLLLEPQEVTAEGCVTLADRRHHHLRTVLNSAPGDTLKVGMLGGNIGSATLKETTPERSILSDLVCTRPPPAKLPLTLILALPRPKAARRICRTAAELGIEKLILLNSYRVEKSYWQSPLVQTERIASYFLEGLEQAGDTVLPELIVENRFKPFVEDRLPALLEGKRALLAHPYGDAIPTEAITEPTVLAVGPEGGFIPYEVEKLLLAGMQTMSLGERILRVESAVPTLLAKLFP